MIVVCPACATRFRIAAAALGGTTGRRLRCANCGKLWHYQPAPEETTPPMMPAAEQKVRGTLRAATPPSHPNTARPPPANEAVALEALDRDTAVDTPRPPPIGRLDAMPPILRADTPSVPRLRAPPARIARPAPIKRRGVRRLAVSLGVAALAAAILLAGFFARHRLAAIWLAAGRAQAMTAVAPPSGAGIEGHNVAKTHQ